MVCAVAPFVSPFTHEPRESRAEAIQGIASRQAVGQCGRRGARPACRVGWHAFRAVCLRTMRRPGGALPSPQRNKPLTLRSKSGCSARKGRADRAPRPACGVGAPHYDRGRGPWRGRKHWGVKCRIRDRPPEKLDRNLKAQPWFRSLGWGGDAERPSTTETSYAA